MATPIVLSVAEKPSVAKELSNIIGAAFQSPPSRGHSYSPYNGVHVIQRCQFRNQPASMNITSVTGHLKELEFVAPYRNWNSCQPSELLSAPITRTVKKENLNIERTLKEEAKKANVLLLWLDCDLEGENIAYEVIDVCTSSNPRINVYRARFSALIPRDIIRALNSPDQPNKYFNAAVEARQEIDLRLGAAFTRFQTKRLQNRYDGIDNLISYGPCQFPTLGFVVDRHWQIERFRPESFWTLHCDYECDDAAEKSGKLNCVFKWDRGKLYDRYTCIVLYDLCVDPDNNGGTARVIKCDERPTVRVRPAPMNTIELQKRASRFLRMSSDRTMAVAEKLYTEGLLSYPRTETDYFKEGYEVQQLLQEHEGHSMWGEFVSDLLGNNKFEWPRHGGHDDQAHPPIHPTKCVELDQFGNEDEKKIYELVSRHFIACCARDGKGSLTTVTVQIPADSWHSEKFSASGLVIQEKNWLEVYGKWEHWSASKVPPFRVGDTFIPKSLLMTSGKTAPPPDISESDLIAEMDKNGIGTDATIASHIATILQRKYVVKDDQRFVPTKLGLALIEAYNDMGYQLNKPFLRAAMEADCQKIAKGELRKEDVIRNCLEQMKLCFDTCVRESDKLDKAVAKYFSKAGGGDDDSFDVIQRDFSNCGNCNKPMDLKVKREQNTTANLNDYTIRNLYCNHCQQAHFLPTKGEICPHQLRCPICNFQVLTVRNTETNKEHTVCPYCFRNPPDGMGDDRMTEFRCMVCSRGDCSLAGRIAGGDLDIAPCTQPNCSNSVRLKKPKNGFMLACSQQGCKAPAKWMPKCITSVVPTNSVCAKCQQSHGIRVLLLKMTLNLSSAPPGVPPETESCPCCAGIWRDLNVEPLPRRVTGVWAGDRSQTENQARRHQLHQRGQQQSVQNHKQVQNNSHEIRQVYHPLVLENLQLPSQLAVPDPINRQIAPHRVLDGPGPMQFTTRGIIQDFNQGSGPMRLANKSRPFSTHGPVQSFDEGLGPLGLVNNKSFVQPAIPNGYITQTSLEQQTQQSNASHPTQYPISILGPDLKILDSTAKALAMATEHTTRNCVNPVQTPLCYCQMPTRVQSVLKNGPNQGKFFFTCSQPQNSRCKFFQWVDSAPP